MKRVFFLALLLPVFSFANHQTNFGPRMPDPEASGREYLVYFESQRMSLLSSDPLSRILDLGKRNLQWLDHMNSLRPESDKIRFTKPGQLTGIPMDKPSVYGEKIILADFAKYQQELPESMRKVLLEGAAMTDQPPLEMDEYIKWGKKTDRLYQITARWIGMRPWLGVLEQRRTKDVRGFYFLGQVQNLKEILPTFSTLPEATKSQYREWLEMMCVNNFGVQSGCRDKVARAEKSNQLLQFYNSLLSASSSLWNSFFRIDQPRDDINWSSQNSALATLHFQDPRNERVLNFLRVNIEDEWKTSVWNLKLDFRSTNSDIPRVVFKPGVTPNVNGLGGNIITMDANTPIDEWDVQWTIRHEFGHVISFPDCYVEFYIPEQEAIVNYQLDVANLMCSRAGKLQDQHYQEMKRVYFRK